MKAYLYIFIFLSCIPSMIGQTVSGIVIDENKEPIPYASVALYQTSDSTLFKGNITNEEGEYKFEDIQGGNYYLQISFLGYQTTTTATFNHNKETSLGRTTLASAAQTLDAVKVKAKKPLITVNAEKVVVNVADHISSAGSDALEMLRKAPGVVVDNNDNISLRGNSGVEIYIDDKPTNMSTADVAALLKNYDASTIQSIEIINNPSAKYDAEGNAGIINIKLKKNKNLGWNGAVNTTAIFGITPKYNAGVNFNYKNKKINLFANAGIRQGIWHNTNNFYRVQNGKYFDQRTTSKSDSLYYPAFNTKLGMDYALSDRQNIGFQITGNQQHNVFNSNNETFLGDESSRNEIDSILIADSRLESDRKNYSFNVNYQFQVSEMEKLSFDLDYAIFNNQSNNLQPNQYLSSDKQEQLSNVLFGNDTETEVDIKSAKADYENKLWNGKISAGFKIADVQTTNDFTFLSGSDGSLTIDPNQSSVFKYTERVTAAYINYALPITQKINLQAGVRMEHTYSRGQLDQLVNSEEDDIQRRYIDFFPSATLSYQYHPKYATSLSFSRRINRPNYQDLNPFEIRMSELAFRKGNPFLNPQYTNSISLNQTLFGFANVSLSYTKTNDFFGQIIDSLDSKRNFITQENIAEFENYSINISSPIPITDWYSGFVSLTVFNQNYTSDFGDNNVLSLDATGMNLFSQHTFTVFKKYKLQVSGWYNNGGVWGGTFVNGGQGALDLGLQSSFFNNQLSVGLSLTDVLYTAGWNARSVFNGINLDANGRWEAQTFRINLNYRFGNQNVRIKSRKTGLDEETKRIGSSSQSQ